MPTTPELQGAALRSRDSHGRWAPNLERDDIAALVGICASGVVLLTAGPVLAGGMNVLQVRLPIPIYQNYMIQMLINVYRTPRGSPNLIWQLLSAGVLLSAQGENSVRLVDALLRTTSRIHVEPLTRKQSHAATDPTGLE